MTLQTQETATRASRRRRVKLGMPTEDPVSHRAEETTATALPPEREARAERVMAAAQQIRWGVRSWLYSVPMIIHGLAQHRVPDRVSMNFVCLTYGLKVWSRRTRVPLEDLDGTVTLWVDTIAVLMAAHTKAEIDAADYRMDQVLTPILDTPVAQLREFAQKLAVALEADPRIPYAIWSHFQWLLNQVIVVAPDEELIRLKTELAGAIARAVEAEVAPQISTAIQNALQWRSEATLLKVQANLEAGEKPKLTGRQSCLFLEVGDQMAML